MTPGEGGADGGDTRSRLIRSAAHLFARRGIEAVKITEIHLLAGQRNASAIHYYFGDKQGLLAAILLENDLLAAKQLEGTSGRDGLGSPAEIVRFLIDRLALGLGDAQGRDWLRIVAQLMSIYREGGLVDDRPSRVAGLLQVGLQSLPYEVIKRRAIAMLQLMTSQIAERARAIDDEWGGKRDIPSDEAFLEDLTSMSLAMITAPWCGEAPDEALS